ncbi:amino acid ABC transporter permease [Agrobacterium tumefaciens]|uniref:amino acid ABC transporter permease n=1 Tax=Agrobacterium tumefaciens TaxID=358 RepID=UPI0015727403|nr:amino acid ABC transporter permease [Agrobacterium tumefaciens]NTE68226.1 amino acid ABC transporter permease [Agrobacterium tumefaciens]
MQGWSTVWAHSDRIAVGLGNTLLLFLLSAILAFALACGIAFLLEGKKNILRWSLRAFLDLVRMTPFLIYVYLLYYGLPELGIRFTAWTAGFAALITYHACYFAEILRAARAALPQGQAESAKAHGYGPFGMYRRILLPQMVLKSGPLFGNQLIACLKDTAFLSIITVFELTAAANDVQATYFVPMPAFITVIILYWFISLGIEGVLRALGSTAKTRGLSYE